VIIATVLVLACALAFALTAPVVARRADPASAVRLLVPTGLVVAAASTFALGVAAFTLIGQWSEIAELGPWSPTVLRSDSPIPSAAAVVGGLLLAYTVVSTVVLISRRSAALYAVHRTCGRLGAPGTVVVVESPAPDAFTTPEATGRIIVTRGMLDALTPPQRAAMLAHERSHLRHRHTWWLLAADLAAAVNPLLRSTARRLRHTTERWADEDAAAAVGDRRLVAHAVAHAALSAHTRREAVTAPAAGGDVPARVRALLRPAARRTWPNIAAAVACLALVAVTGATSLGLEHAGEKLFEKAMAAHGAPTHTVVATHPSRSAAGHHRGGPA
jgi:Zn-dependent protease with chaperone function